MSEYVTLHVVQVKYTGEVDKSELGLLRVEDGLDMENGAAAQAGAELWDMTRPLIGDCELQLLKFDDPDAKAVGSLSMWHRLSCTDPVRTHIFDIPSSS
eukprot:31309-Eustigmatos_ZCMA.PRE.1